MKDSLTLTPLHATSPDMELAVNLYTEAFPACERREAADWLHCVEEEPLFRLFAIRQAGAFSGFISCWQFPDFVYVEHFAVNRQARGNGIGAKAIEAARAHYGTLPFVLEVEPPESEMAVRRIGFYSRQGFTLSKAPYLQPPYRKGDEWIALQLMSTQPEWLDEQINRVKTSIYRAVYHTNEEG